MIGIKPSSKKKEHDGDIPSPQALEKNWNWDFEGILI